MFNVQSQSSEALVEALTCMDNLDSKYGEKQVGTLQMDDLVLFSSSVQDLKAYCNSSSLWINFYRQRIMLSESRVMEGIQALVNVRCPEILKLADTPAGMDPDDWLVKLIFNVQRLLACGVILKVNSKDYLTLGKSGPVMFEETPEDFKSRTRHKSSRQTHVTTKDYISRILHTWFGACSSFTSQARASLVGILLDHLGPGCLFLPEVWSLYDKLPGWLFSSNCPRFSDANSTEATFVSTYLDDFHTALSERIRDDATAVTSMNKLQAEYIGIYEKTRIYAEKTLAAKLKAPNLKKTLASITSDIHDARRARQAKTAEKAKKTFVPEPHASGSTLITSIIPPGLSPSSLLPTAIPSSTTASHPTADPVSSIIKFLKD
ncbi:hypothetical protein BDY19DRAFT_999119, partial [Irpex rosettiformis]